MPDDNHPTQKLSLLTTIAVVAGGMIGSGIFLLPAALAEFGGISILGWLFTTAGALLIALSLGRLSRRIPETGGPYVYTRDAFGDLTGFLIGWGYWICVLVSGAAVATAFVGYLGVFIPSVVSNNILAALAALALIWGLAFINISGVKETGRLQLWTTILKLIPLVAMIFAGAIYFQGDHFIPFNATVQSGFSAITATASLTLWAFLGMEAASIIAGNVQDPERNVAKATTYGVIIAAIVYCLGSTAVMAILPLDILGASTAPFADAAEAVWGKWAAIAVAIGAVISCVGALNAITFVQGQMPFAMSRDKLFPKTFAVLSSQGTPVPAFILSASLVTLIMAANYTKGLVELFKFLILLATLSALLPYAFCALAEMIFAIRDKRTLSTRLPMKVIILAGLALIYAIWAITGVGLKAIGWGLALLAAGIPVFLLFRNK